MNGRCYLKKREDFSSVYENGTVCHAKSLSVKYIRNNLDYSRWGIVTSKKIGGAVVRNHVKRQIRDIIRQQRLTGGFDIVIMTRPLITTSSYEEISRTLLSIFKKCGFLV